MNLSQIVVGTESAETLLDQLFLLLVDDIQFLLHAVVFRNLGNLSELLAKRMLGLGALGRPAVSGI